jgi:hypothetical protein
MKITKTRLKQIIKEESIMDFQGEFDPSANMPPESFGGDEVTKKSLIQSAAEFYSIPAEEFMAVLDSTERTAEDINELLTNALIQAHRTMPFDEKYGPNSESKIGEYVMKILRKQ